VNILGPSRLPEEELRFYWRYSSLAVTPTADVAWGESTLESLIPTERECTALQVPAPGTVVAVAGSGHVDNAVLGFGTRAGMGSRRVRLGSGTEESHRKERSTEQAPEQGGPLRGGTPPRTRQSPFWRMAGLHAPTVRDERNHRSAPRRGPQLPDAESDDSTPWGSGRNGLAPNLPQKAPNAPRVLRVVPATDTLRGFAALPG
jgi:hypothetical protein